MLCQLRRAILSVTSPCILKKILQNEHFKGQKLCHVVLNYASLLKLRGNHLFSRHKDDDFSTMINCYTELD